MQNFYQHSIFLAD